MTDRELMQMALDAMESFEGGTNGLYKGEFAEERKALRDRLAQPEREWVGLTDDEVDQFYADTVDEFQFYQAIEAKLKEKNT
ncbi:MAG: hypothetical protein ACO24H_05185 [Polynucleobacter sp.]